MYHKTVRHLFVSILISFGISSICFGNIYKVKINKTHAIGGGFYFIYGLNQNIQTYEFLLFSKDNTNQIISVRTSSKPERIFIDKKKEFICIFLANKKGLIYKTTGPIFNLLTKISLKKDTVKYCVFSRNGSLLILYTTNEYQFFDAHSLRVYTDKIEQKKIHTIAASTKKGYYGLFVYKDGEASVHDIKQKVKYTINLKPKQIMRIEASNGFLKTFYKEENEACIHNLKKGTQFSIIPKPDMAQNISIKKQRFAIITYIKSRYIDIVDMLQSNKKYTLPIKYLVIRDIHILNNRFPLVIYITPQGQVKGDLFDFESLHDKLATLNLPESKLAQAPLFQHNLGLFNYNGGFADLIFLKEKRVQRIITHPNRSIFQVKIEKNKFIVVLYKDPHKNLLLDVIKIHNNTSSTAILQKKDQQRFGICKDRFFYFIYDDYSADILDIKHNQKHELQLTKGTITGIEIKNNHLVVINDSFFEIINLYDPQKKAIISTKENITLQNIHIKEGGSVEVAYNQALQIFDLNNLSNEHVIHLKEKEYTYIKVNEYEYCIHYHKSNKIFIYNINTRTLKPLKNISPLHIKDIRSKKQRYLFVFFYEQNTLNIFDSSQEYKKYTIHLKQNNVEDVKIKNNFAIISYKNNMLEVTDILNQKQICLIPLKKKEIISTSILHNSFFCLQYNSGETKIYSLNDPQKAYEIQLPTEGPLQAKIINNRFAFFTYLRPDRLISYVFDLTTSTKNPHIFLLQKKPIKHHGILNDRFFITRYKDNELEIVDIQNEIPQFNTPLDDTYKYSFKIFQNKFLFMHLQGEKGSCVRLINLQKPEIKLIYQIPQEPLRKKDVRLNANLLQKRYLSLAHENNRLTIIDIIKNRQYSCSVKQKEIIKMYITKDTYIDIRYKDKTQTIVDLPTNEILFETSKPTPFSMALNNNFISSIKEGNTLELFDALNKQTYTTKLNGILQDLRIERKSKTLNLHMNYAHEKKIIVKQLTLNRKRKRESGAEEEERKRKKRKFAI